MIKEKEIWMPIPGYEDLYMASESGKIKALQIKKYRGRYLQLRPEQLLKEKTTINGYKQVVLSKDGRRKHFGVHQLVALAFLKNKEKKPTVNHINGIKYDNRLSNLEWATQKEQINHCDHNSLRDIKGEKCHLSKLNNEQVLEIRKSRLSARELAPKYGMYWSTIQKIKNRKTWKHV